jgi:membrane protein implicated in regulation of membrane protease activity
VLLILLLALILGVALGIVLLIEIPAGSTAISASIGYAVLFALVALGTVAYFGRRRQKRVQAERAEQIAARSR